MDNWNTQQSREQKIKRNMEKKNITNRRWRMTMEQRQMNDLKDE